MLGGFDSACFTYALASVGLPQFRFLLGRLLRLRYARLKMYRGAARYCSLGSSIKRRRRLAFIAALWSPDERAPGLSMPRSGSRCHGRRAVVSMGGARPRRRRCAQRCRRRRRSFRSFITPEEPPRRSPQLPARDSMRPTLAGRADRFVSRRPPIDGAELRSATARSTTGAVDVSLRQPASAVDRHAIGD